MTEKELRKLNRYQLLDLLVVQTERADELQKKVDALEEKLRDRELQMSKLGSIAEASLQISGVFEASQKAADLYLDAVKKQAGEMIEVARRQAAEIISRAETEARRRSVLRQDKEEK